MNRYQFSKFFITSKPFLYKKYINLLRPNKKKLIIGDATELVIDGFPRSANTFAVVAFEAVQKRTVVIAHHTHVPATIIEGCKRKLPALLLIRDPLSCVTSASIFRNTAPVPLLEEWLWFYQNCLPFKSALTIASFENVTNHYDQVISSLNKKFNTNFSLFHHETNLLTSVNLRVEKIAKEFGQSELQVARPSDSRKYLKEQIKATISKESKMLNKAQSLYDKYFI